MGMIFATLLKISAPSTLQEGEGGEGEGWLRLACIEVLSCVLACRRVYLSIAAAAIYMASQASEVKKTQKGLC